MKKDYYEILNVKRSVTDEEISVAYKKLALRHHPLKNPQDMQMNLEKFHELCEAYEVLSNPVFKTVYDQYGDETLRMGVRDSNGTRTGGYVYQQNCYQIFEKYILQYNSFYDIIDTKGRELSGSMFGTAFGGVNEPKPIPEGDCFLEIPCTISEFYNGCMKQVEYQRKVLGLDGKTIKSEKCIKEIYVRPGYSERNNLTYKGEGNQQYRRAPTDLLVSFREVQANDNCPNAELQRKYRRVGNDLVFTQDISLQQAINSDCIRVSTLDGRLLMVAMDNIISPKYSKKIEGEGMPISTEQRLERDEMKRGDLYVKFNIQFPQSLTESQRQRIEKILSKDQ